MCAPSFLVCAHLTTCVRAHSLEGTLIKTKTWMLTFNLDWYFTRSNATVVAYFHLIFSSVIFVSICSSNPNKKQSHQQMKQSTCMSGQKKKNIETTTTLVKHQHKRPNTMHIEGLTLCTQGLTQCTQGLTRCTQGLTRCILHDIQDIISVSQVDSIAELEKRMLLSQMLNQTNISHNCKFRILAQTMKTYTECILQVVHHKDV